MKKMLTAALAAALGFAACGSGEGEQALDDVQAEGVETWVFQGVGLSDDYALECNFPPDGEGVGDPQCWIPYSSEIPTGPDGEGLEPGGYMEPTTSSCEGGDDQHFFGIPSGRNTVVGVIDGHVVAPQHVQNVPDFLSYKGICGYTQDESALVTPNDPDEDNCSYSSDVDTWGVPQACTYDEYGYVEEVFASEMHKAIAEDGRWETLAWSTPYRWEGRAMYGNDAYFVLPAFSEGMYTEADIPEAIEVAREIPSADWANVCPYFNLNLPAGDGRINAMEVLNTGRRNMGEELYDGSVEGDRALWATFDLVFVVCGKIHEVSE